MELGISTSFCYDIPIEQNLRSIAKAGFEFVSIGGRIRHSGYNKPDSRHKVKLAAQNYGLRIDSVHAPFDPTCDLTQLEDVLLNGAIIEAKRAIEAAADLGAKYLILHLNSFRPRNVSERLKRIKSSLSAVLKHAEQHNVIIALENIDPDSEVLFKFAMDLFDSKYLQFCYDNGHEALYSDTPALMQKYADRLAVIHLHDNDRKSDLHLIPSEGSINLPALAGQLNKLSKIPDITLECEMENTVYQEPDGFLTAAHRQGMRFIEMVKH